MIREKPASRVDFGCADMNGAPLTRTPPRQSWGRGPSPSGGWRRIQARWSTCLLLLAVQRRRVESLGLGALSSSPVHRALVLVLGTNIAVQLLLDVFEVVSRHGV